MTTEQWAAWISAIGTMLGGLATIAGVIAAAIVASRWRHQARAARQAEVAGMTLVAALRFLRKVGELTLEYVITPNLCDRVNERWEVIATERAAFEQALEMATAYLPSPTVDLLLEVSSRALQINGAQFQWAFLRDAARNAVTDAETVEARRLDAFGPHVNESLKDLESRVVRELRGLARIESR